MPTWDKPEELPAQELRHRIGPEEEGSDRLKRHTYVKEPHVRERHPPPTLSFVQHSFSEPAYRGCGGFSRAITWQLKGTHRRSNGYIVQKVQNIFRINRCDGSPFNYSTQTYWEAWEVVEGVISGSIFDVRGGDVFAMDSIPNSKGSWEKKGWAKYLDGYKDPENWGTQAFAQAGLSLPSTLTEPGPPWSEGGALYRWYRMDYDCCNGKNASALTAWDRDSRQQIE